MHSFFKDIQYAIQHKRRITFNYEENGLRTGDPHALYINDDGLVELHVYQISGFSDNPSELPVWKTFVPSKMRNITVHHDSFAVAPGYDRSWNGYINAIERI